MAKRVSEIILGIDVAKEELVICEWQRGEVARIANEPGAIKHYLSGFGAAVRIAVEPTSSYHFALIEGAHALGQELYLINPRQLAHYREAVNLRNKRDPDDAWLLARYLAHEGGQLRPFKPHDRRAQQLWALLKRRAAVVGARQQLQQSLAELQLSTQALWRELTRLLKRIEQRILKLLRQLGWWAAYQRCLSIPGIGPLNAAALVAAYHRGAFASTDAFIAFLGLDVRVRESGRFKGERKLTKRGDSELRRLLYCASQPARSYRPFDQYYQAQLDKGLPKIAARIILARKIARIAFALMAHEQSFNKHETADC